MKVSERRTEAVNQIVQRTSEEDMVCWRVRGPLRYGGEELNCVFVDLEEDDGNQERNCMR